MGIEDFWSVRRGINPFTRMAMSFEGLDVRRLCSFSDDPRSIALRPRKPKRGGSVLRGCRFGGDALLPPKMKWPHGPQRPLSFIGQLDFEQLAVPASASGLALPGQGVLGFFYDLEGQHWGLEKSDAKSWRIVYVPSVDTARTVEPDDADPVPLRVLDPVVNVATAAKSKSPPDHHVGGEAAWIHGDPRIDIQLMLHGLDRRSLSALQAAERRGIDVVRVGQDATRWRLLWQIDTEKSLFMWGDAGRLYVLIREDDLKAARFDEAWCVVHSH